MKIEDSIYICNSTLKEINTLINAIYTNKPSGILNMPTKILRDAFWAMPYILLNLFNTSFIQGKFVNAWKVATITSLFKAGDRQDMGNIRPISILKTPGKMMEKIFHRHLNEHIEKIKS